MYWTDIDSRTIEVSDNDGEAKSSHLGFKEQVRQCYEQLYKCGCIDCSCVKGPTKVNYYDCSSAYYDCSSAYY